MRLRDEEAIRFAGALVLEMMRSRHASARHIEVAEREAILATDT